jgi:template-activating factor I
MNQTDLHVKEFTEYEKLRPLYDQRRELMKSIPMFWPVALMRHPSIERDLEKPEDQAAIKYLKDVWVSRNPAELRAYTLEFASFLICL